MEDKLKQIQEGFKRVECNVGTKASKKTKRVEVEEANYRAVNGIWS
jgi:hypothetical protein